MKDQASIATAATANTISSFLLFYCVRQFHQYSNQYVHAKLGNGCSPSWVQVLYVAWPLMLIETWLWSLWASPSGERNHYSSTFSCSALFLCRFKMDLIDWTSCVVAFNCTLKRWPSTFLLHTLKEYGCVQAHRGSKAVNKAADLKVRFMSTTVPPVWIFQGSLMGSWCE